MDLGRQPAPREPMRPVSTSLPAVVCVPLFAIRRVSVDADGGGVDYLHIAVKRFHCDDHDKLRRHLQDFIGAYNFGRRLKTLKGLTPYEFICAPWTSDPDRFIIDPIHQMPGLNT